MKPNSKNKKTTFYLICLLLIVVLSSCSIDEEREKIIVSSEKQCEFVSAVTNLSNGVELDEYLEAGIDGFPIPFSYEGTANTAVSFPSEIQDISIATIEGSYLYQLNQFQGLIICDISQPENPFIVGSTSITGQPEEIFIRDDLAYILVSHYDIGSYDPSVSSPTVSSQIVVLDIADKSQPQITGSFDLEGVVTDSRLTGSILYIVCSIPSFSSFYLPIWEEDDGVIEPVAQENIYIASINISDPYNIELADRKDFSNSTCNIHITEEAIFVEIGIENDSSFNTNIIYIDISNPDGSMIRRGSIETPGHDMSKMDYYDGYLRVCSYEKLTYDNVSFPLDPLTFDLEDSGTSHLYVIDTNNPDDLQMVGSVALEHTDQLSAVTFDGNRAYIVIDGYEHPLWIIDLSDPSRPQIKGKPDVAVRPIYIEPRGDRFIIADDSCSCLGISISLFDVSDPNTLTLMDQLSFGGQNRSQTREDIHAFTLLDNDNNELEHIHVSYSIFNFTDGHYPNDYRLQLIDYSEDNLAERGWVTHKGSILPSHGFSNQLFSISRSDLQVIDIANRDDPLIIASLNLTSNIIDFIPLDNCYGVEVINEGFGNYSLRTIQLFSSDESKIASELTLDYGNIPFIIENGNLVYIIRTNSTPSISQAITDIAPSSYASSTRVQIYDFSDVSNPCARVFMDLPGSYIMNNSRQDIIQLKEDVLIFYNQTRSYSYTATNFSLLDENEKDDDDESKEENTQNLTIFNGFIVADLSDPNNLQVASKIPIESIRPTHLFAIDDILYYSYSLLINDEDQGQLQTKYYLGRIDLSDLAHPVESSPVNIPGPCVGFDESGDFAYTINSEWNIEWGPVYSQDNSFCVVKIEENKAYLIDTIELDDYPFSIVFDNNYAYLSGYNNHYGNSSAQLTIIDLTHPESLITYAHTLTQIQICADILGAQNNKVFFSSWEKEVLCYDISNPEVLQLEEQKKQSSRAERIIFFSGKAYVPLGYYGLWIKDLE